MAGTPFDFTQPHAIGERIEQVGWLGRGVNVRRLVKKQGNLGGHHGILQFFFQYTRRFPMAVPFSSHFLCGVYQVPGAPPGGYDHNYVLFNMGPQARFIVKKGVASEK